MYLIELKQETVKNNLSNLQATKDLNIGFGIYVGTEAENALKRKKMIGHLLFLIQISSEVFEGAENTKCSFLSGFWRGWLFPFVFPRLQAH